MSEENKIVELKEEDLEEVSGGGPDKESNKKPKMYECMICQMTFSDAASLARHDREKHKP